MRQAYSKLNVFDRDTINLQETFALKDSKLIIDKIEEDKSYIGVTDFSKDQIYTETWQEFKKILNPN